MKKLLLTTLLVVGLGLIVAPTVLLSGCSKSSKNFNYVSFNQKTTNSYNATLSTTEMANDSKNYDAIELAKNTCIAKMTDTQVKNEVEKSIGEYYCAYEFESYEQGVKHEFEIEHVQFLSWDSSKREVNAKFSIEVDTEANDNDDEIIVDVNFAFILNPMFSTLTKLISDLQGHLDAGNQNLDIEDLAELYDNHFQTNIEDYFEEGKKLNVDQDTTILGYGLQAIKISQTDPTDPKSVKIELDADITNPIFCPTLNNNYIFYLEGSIHPKK